MALYNRYYLKRDQSFPEMEIWTEMTGTACGDPELKIFGRNEDGPQVLVKLNFAEAVRLKNVLDDKFLAFSSKFLQQETAE